MDNDQIVAWVGTWTQGDYPGMPVVWAGGWSPSWWYIEDVADGIVAAIPTKPGPNDCVSDLRGLTQDDFDLLLHETRARQALGDVT